ncbi:hypothetical protein CPB83DRAFT_778727, partial [Crepidotus variabilis]
MRPSKFTEAGCAACGQLRPLNTLTLREDVKCSLDPLIVPGLTRKERKTQTDLVEDIGGPVIDNACQHICSNC